jgi:hypothetical protein
VRHYCHDDRHGESKPDANFCAGHSDLFGRQFFAANHFEQRHHRNLGACGKYHGYNYLHIHTHAGAMRHYRHDDRCGQSKPDAEFRSGRSDLLRGQFFVANNFEQWHFGELGAGGK